MKKLMILALCVCLAVSMTACLQRGEMKESISSPTAPEKDVRNLDDMSDISVSIPSASQGLSMEAPQKFEMLHKQIEDMLPWLEGLDKDIYSDYYFAPEGPIEEREYIVVQVTDVATFKESPAMKEAEENGWVFDLEEVHLSANKIDTLITKMLNWDRRQELQISIFGASHDKSTMSVGTTGLSPQNRAIIEEYVGIGSLEFYNPEVANEVIGTGEYRMTGLDGIIEWYIPRLFDKPFVYNVLVKGSGLIKSPGLSVFNSGNKPEWNFYLQYDSATSDEQMAEQIEKKLTEVYNERYDPDLIAYTIEPVPVERVG